MVGCELDPASSTFIQIGALHMCMGTTGFRYVDSAPILRDLKMDHWRVTWSLLNESISTTSIQITHLPRFWHIVGRPTTKGKDTADHDGILILLVRGEA